MHTIARHNWNWEVKKLPSPFQDFKMKSEELILIFFLYFPFEVHKMVNYQSQYIFSFIHWLSNFETDFQDFCYLICVRVMKFNGPGWIDTSHFVTSVWSVTQVRKPFPRIMILNWISAKTCTRWVWSRTIAFNSIINLGKLTSI